MNVFYIVKAKGTKEDQESGKIVKVTDTYLVSAVSFTDAETIATELANSRINDYEINSISKTKVCEVINQDSERWYQCKVNILDTDEKGKETKTPYLYIVGGSTVGDVHKTLVDFMKDTLNDYTIERIDETGIVEITND